MATRMAIEDRALGALAGAALGDALGMPTQILTREEIAAAYGHVGDFVAPLPDHPVSRGLAAGTVTDDTEQMLLLARQLLEGGEAFDQQRWVAALVAWETDVIARGSHDLLGPSTKRAIAAIRAGTPPQEAGRHGDTNGAAMRIAPVGVIMPSAPLQALVDRVAETSLATHNTGVAIAAASAVAAAISRGVEGGGWRAAIDTAIAAARTGAASGHPLPGPSMDRLIADAVALAQGHDHNAALDRIAAETGTGVDARQSVPAAFAVLALANGDAWRACVLAANLGGDTDTIGAIAGAIAGACCGFSSLPQDRIAQLRGVDLAELRALSTELVAARLAAGSVGSGIA